MFIPSDSFEREVTLIANTIHCHIIDAVKVWEEPVIIPTYEVGPPEKNPMFLEKRVYQGSSGVVYPHPVIEKIYDEKIDKTYQAVYLENEYIKVMILPQLGSRIKMAFDKVKNRHFIYYNHRSVGENIHAMGILLFLSCHQFF